MPMPSTVLLAEDNPADVFLVREAIKTHNLEINLHVAKDGQAAIEFIEAAERGGDIPQLALLDINLPKKSGLEVLDRLRQSSAYGTIPVAMISSSPSPHKVINLSQESLDHFFTKPSDYEKFMKLGELIRQLLNRA